jgi:hypothetical protein
MEMRQFSCGVLMMACTDRFSFVCHDVHYCQTWEWDECCLPNDNTAIFGYARYRAVQSPDFSTLKVFNILANW